MYSIFMKTNFLYIYILVMSPSRAEGFSAWLVTFFHLAQHRKLAANEPQMSRKRAENKSKTSRKKAKI